MQFSVNSEAFKPAFQACLILQQAESASLENLLQEFVTPDVLANKLATYNFNFVLANTLHKLSKSEKLAILAYSNFTFWPKEMTYLILEEPDLLSQLLANTWQSEIADYSDKVAEFDDFVSESSLVKLNKDLQALADKSSNNVSLDDLTDSLMSEAKNDENSFVLTDLPLIVLEAQANYNILRLLKSLQRLTENYLADNKFWRNCVNSASLSTLWQLVGKNLPIYLDNLAAIDRMSDEMSNFITQITKSLAPIYLKDLNELAKRFLTKLEISSKNCLNTDASLLAEFALLFAADQAFYGEKKTALHSFMQKNSYLELANQDLNYFRTIFFRIFDTVLAKNSGNIYLTEFLIEANDAVLAKRLHDYAESKYTRASLLELKDGQKEWLRALAHYGLALREN